MAALSSSEDELATVIVSAIIHQRRRRKLPKRFWVRPIFTKRRQQGEYHNLLQEMRLLILITAECIFNIPYFMWFVL